MIPKTFVLVGIGALASASVILVRPRLPESPLPPATPPSAKTASPETTSAVENPPALDLADTTLDNRHAYIPPQCYVDTRGPSGKVHNSCYTCHTDSQPPNYLEDADLQQMYDFPGPARTNRWANLFVDRSAAVAQISDETIARYVRENNYADEGGVPRLVQRLSPPPEAWDLDRDGKWDGYLPDIHFAFDDEGFDRSPAGELTGWRAYAYFPLPGAFMPTNGSMGDAMIRLPPPFRNDDAGQPDMVVYRTNLAIVEALISARDIPIDATDERALGVDLDKDGALAMASIVKFDWAPLEGRDMSFVGQARVEQREGRVHLARGLFPEGTEFVHSVRYLDVVDHQVAMAPRMKELRYMQKIRWVNYSQLQAAAAEELKEGHDFPDRLRTVMGDAERGAFNGQGWRILGFIEDSHGDLRPQTFEETAFCVGCHSGVGATTDAVFSFGRKLGDDSPSRGWRHGYALRGVPEPKMADGRYEYSTYLEQNGAGDDARTNTEVQARFFAPDGSLRQDAVLELHQDIGALLLPSPARAVALNKAYRVLVAEQSFTRGRDVTLTPSAAMLRTVDEGRMTGVDAPL